MRLSAEREKLASALGLAERAAAARDTMPVLSGVRLTAGDGWVDVIATDLEVSAALRIPAETDDPGDRVVDARLFTAVVRRLPGASVRIWVDEDGTTLNVESGASHFSLVSSDAQEFPEIPRVSDGWVLKVPSEALKQGIAQTMFAAASSEQRPLLSGVLVEVEGKFLRLVATDSSRLAYRELVLAEEAEPLGSPGLFTPRVIVPARAMAEMSRWCDLEGVESVELEVGERLVSLRTGDGQARLTSRLIEDTFPQYRQVFMEGLPTRVTFDRRQMLEAVQRAALLSRRGPSVVVLEMAEGGVTVRARETDVGLAEEHVQAHLEGPGATAAYQARFLEDVLKVLDSDELVLELGDPGRQATLRVPGDPGYRYIVMPVRLT